MAPVPMSLSNKEKDIYDSFIEGTAEKEELIKVFVPLKLIWNNFWNNSL